MSGPASYLLAEDKRLNMSSSFTVALESEPLSDVTLTFSSRFGAVTFEPSSVLFSYLDFSVPVTVSTFGVDNAVDQGESHSDWVEVTVTSADSWFECDDQLRPACGQAVAYNGFNVTSVSATVLDDDIAALLVKFIDSSTGENVLEFGGESGLSINATCDNRGDPLSPALLSVSLATEPVGAVSVSLNLSGATGFSALNAVPSGQTGGGLVPSFLLGALPLDAAAQTAAEVLEITFGPGNWSTQVMVAVWGAAAAPMRPVCANASRFCSDLVGRSSEAVTTFVTSADPLYNTAPPSFTPSLSQSWLPSLSPVGVSVHVVRDAVDPPKVVGGVAPFSNTLQVLSFTFDTSSDRAGGLSGLFSCVEIFNFSSSSSANTLFGSGNTCSFDSSGKLLQVTFGNGATVVPGDELHFLPNLLRSSLKPNALTSLVESVIVEAPQFPTSPSAALSVSTPIVGLCDDLGFNAAGSVGSGGRPMKFAWSVALSEVSAPASMMQNMTQHFDDATAAGFKSRVTLPFHSMPPGLAFEVTLTATNFLNLTDSTVVPIRKLTRPAPAVAISPSVVTGVTHTSALTLTAVAELPKLGCVSSIEGKLLHPPSPSTLFSFLLNILLLLMFPPSLILRFNDFTVYHLPSHQGNAVSATKMGFTWVEVNGLLSPASLSGTSNNPRVLSLPAGALAAIDTYNFAVTAYLVDFPNVNNTASVQVAVGSEPLLANIAGGKSFAVGVDSDFVLDGSGSEDPDELLKLPLLFSWTCSVVAGVTSPNYDKCPLYPPATNVSVVTIAAGALPVGSYLFSLTVAKGGAGTGYELRNTTTTASVEVVAGAPPSVSLAQLHLLGPNADTVNPGSGYLLLSGSARSASKGANVTELTWIAMGDDAATPFVIEENGAAEVSSTVNSRAGLLNAVLNVAALTPGSSYTFQLLAQDSDSVEGFATLSLTVNKSPSSGSLNVFPQNGLALTTAFELAAPEWVDDDLPFSFVFGTAPVVAGVDSAGYAVDTGDVGSLTPFGDERGDAFYSGLVLSQGQLATNYTTGCFVEVIDALGAGAYGSTTVRVVSAGLSTQQLLNISTAKSQEYRDSGNANGAKQVLQASAVAATAGSSNTGGARRRSLLALTAAEKQASYALRASLLEGLWQTYPITPLTQADIASLIGVLVSIVEQPSEVSTQVATGALDFAATVNFFSSSFSVRCFVTYSWCCHVKLNLV